MPVQNIFSPEQQAEVDVLDRKQQIANALLGQGLNPQQGRMIGNVFVPPNPLQQVVSGLGGFMAGRKIDDQRADLVADAQAGQKADLNAITRAMSGRTIDSTRAEPEANPQAALQGILPSLESPFGQQVAQNFVTKNLTPQKPMVVGKTLMSPEGKVIASDPTVAAENAANRAAAVDKQVSEQAFRDEQARQAALDRQALVQAQQGAGKVPPGYRQLPNGNLEAIPGGPADTKLQGQYNADTATYQGGLSDLDRLATSANEVLNHPGLKGITGLRGKIPNVPGSDAANAQAKLETLKSQVGFGVLQAMRNASKTGGALGNVSDAEGRRLEANLAALHNAQSYEQFQTELKKIIEFTDQAKDRMREAYNMKYAGERRTGVDTPSLAEQAGRQDRRKNPRGPTTVVDY